MKKKWINKIIIGIMFFKYKIEKDKKTKENIDEKEKLIFKQEEVLKVYERWIDSYQKNTLISEFLERNQYQKIAIYGLGRLGKNIYNELKNSMIDVLYIIDRNYCDTNNKYYNTPCYYPEDYLPKVDLI